MVELLSLYVVRASSYIHCVRCSSQSITAEVVSSIRILSGKLIPAVTQKQLNLYPLGSLMCTHASEEAMIQKKKMLKGAYLAPNDPFKSPCQPLELL